MPYKSITVQQNFHKMRSGVERCFMELFVVCIHINNVDPQKLVQVGKRANTVRPYDFVAVGFSLFYSIFKLHSEYDTGYYALGFVYTKYHNARPRLDTSTLQPVPESLIVFTKSQGLYVPASI